MGKNLDKLVEDLGLEEEIAEYMNRGGSEYDSIQEWMDEREAIYERQMAEVGAKNAARTAAVLNGTSDKLVKNQETVVVELDESPAPSAVMYCAFGFVFGILIASVFFFIKLKKVRKECNIRVDEARAAMDRMLKVAARD